MHKGTPGLTLDNPVPHSPVNPFICIRGFHLQEKSRGVEVKGREFQTGMSPPILPKLDILLLHLSWGAYQIQSKIKLRSPQHWAAGTIGSGALGCWIEVGAEPQDHPTNPTALCAGGGASLNPTLHSKACSSGAATRDGAWLG